MKTAVVTAKDKLRLMLSYDLDGIAMSAENPEKALLRASIKSVENAGRMREARPILGRPVHLGA